jgi:uncharacterized protein YndB with AHSA1/START domain
MSSWKEQALIEAPVESVWSLLEDPSRFPDWSGDWIDVTGVPTRIERGSRFGVTGKGPFGITANTTFMVDELDDMHEIKLRCQASGFYSHWVLTEAQGQTFAEVEMGVERRPGLDGRISDAMHTKGYLRRAAHASMDGLRRAVSGSAPTA